MFTSCQKDTLNQEEPLSGAHQNTIKPLEASDEMLSFNSEEEMYVEADRLMASNYASSSTKTAHSGFTSINDIYEQALADLEIVEKSKSFELAAQVKEKYQLYLLYNDDPSDDEMYNPYIKTSVGYSYVCNKNGDVIINGEVKNFNIATSAKDTETYKLSHRVQTKAVYGYTVDGIYIEEEPNSLYIKRSGKRKMWAKTHRPFGKDHTKVTIQMHSTKESWFGSYAYSTVYYIKYEPTDLSYWDEPYIGLLKQCINSKNEVHNLGEYKTLEAIVGDIAYKDGELEKGIAAFRIHSRGTAGVSGVLRINVTRYENW